MGISQPQPPQKAGIYDASGRFLAPAEGNACYEPAPEKRCEHGALCPSCGKR